MALFDNLRAPSGMFGASQPQASAMMQPVAMPQPQQQTGFNKPGGWAEKLGALGGVFLNAGGMPNNALQNYQELQQHRRDLALKAQMDAAKMYQPQDVGGSLVRLNPQTGKYEAVYTPDPKPVNNDTVNDYQFIASTLGKDAADGYLRNMAAGPPMAVENPDGTRTIYPRGAFGSAPMASGPAPGTIKNGYRFKGGNPKDQNSWEPIGGATPSASGGFRR